MDIVPATRLSYEEMEALHLTALEIASHVDEDQLLRTIIRRAIDLLQGKGGGIWKILPHEDELIVVDEWGNKTEMKGRRIKVGEGLARQVFLTGEMLIVEDYNTWEGRIPGLEQELFRAVLAVPLELIDRGVIGVLYVTDESGRGGFTEHDGRLMSFLANHAAIAIAHGEKIRLSESRAAQLSPLEKVTEQMLSMNDIPSYRPATTKIPG